MRIFVCRLPSAGEMFLLRGQKSLEHQPFGEEFNCPYQVDSIPKLVESNPIAVQHELECKKLHRRRFDRSGGNIVRRKPPNPVRRVIPHEVDGSSGSIVRRKPPKSCQTGNFP